MSRSTAREGVSITGTRSHSPGARRGPCQEPVNGCQGRVNAVVTDGRQALTQDVIENLIGAIVGLAVLAYLVYALIRPDKF